jgi:uncharacterized membrane protein
MKITSNRIIFLLSLGGIALCAYMWSYQVSDRIIPCTDKGCSHVLTSDYSHLFGIPVSVFGFFYYVFVAFVSGERFFIKHNLLDKFLIALTAWGIIFSGYLRYLEFAKIGSICIWCWVSVVIILLISITLFLEKRSLRS